MHIKILCFEALLWSLIILVATYPASDTWQKDNFTFIPNSDVIVSIALRGPLIKAVVDSDELSPVFMDFDAISMEGATMVNGSFEESDPSGGPKGWQYYVPSNNKTHITDLNRARVMDGDAARRFKIHTRVA